MSSVHIQTMSQWERRIIVVKGGIRGRVVDLYTGLSQAGDEFLNPANALNTCYRRAVGGRIPAEGEISETKNRIQCQVIELLH